jgi:hypothetical protein
MWKTNDMTSKHNAQILCLTLCWLLTSISGCSKSVDPQDQELDLSKITATGTLGPGDFIGNIDLSDWSPSSYSTIVFGSSFWMQKQSIDTLYFYGQFSGDSASSSQKIYNYGNADLQCSLSLSYPFSTTTASLTIQPKRIEFANIWFVLPDTTNTVYNRNVLMRFSTGDSIVLKLKGSRESYDSGAVVVTLPKNFSLAPAYPNPTNGHITFVFSVPQRTDAVLNLVNKKNEVVATVAQGNYVPGVHFVSWNANLANGNYRAVFQAGDYISSGDIQILK